MNERTFQDKTMWSKLLCVVGESLSLGLFYLVENHDFAKQRSTAYVNN